MTVKVTGVSDLGRVIDARISESRDNFNRKLDILVTSWLKAASDTYLVKDGYSAFDRITEVVPLSRQKGGTRKTIKAKIIFTVIALPLTDYSVIQQRVGKGKTLKAASSIKGKFKESGAGQFTSYEDTFTKARLLKRTTERLVIVGGSKKGTLGRAEGVKAFMYSPTNRVTAKPETPLGVYVRLQKATWAGKVRLPTYKLYAPPLAVIMFSKRVIAKARVNEQLEGLKDV